MAHELNLGGTIYISSKSAAEKTGYSQDYIGQLARAGKIVAQRIGGLWYIAEESLRDHKAVASTYTPTPPVAATTKTSGSENAAETLLSFDGKKYISAAEAAKITSYSQDYVGQLARSGTILSRQVGNRWYVDVEGIKAHKAEKDSLLAAVQADSVGLLHRQSQQAESSKEPEPEYKMHYSYFSEPGNHLPALSKTEKSPEEMPEISLETETREAETQRIPIKIVRTQKPVTLPAKIASGRVSVKITHRSRWYAVLSVFVVVSVVVLAFNINIFNQASFRVVPGSDVVRGTQFIETIQKGFDTVKDFLRTTTTKELRYQRTQ